MKSKVVTEAEMGNLAASLGDAGKIVVTTSGSFDILHAAHVQVLEAAKDLGDKLVVLLNSDRSIRSFKGPLRPIVAEDERAVQVETRLNAC